MLQKTMVQIFILQNNITSQVGRSEKFLRSFGKQWEAALPTFLLRINEVDQKWEEEKNCAVTRQKTVILFGGGASTAEISPVVEMTERIGRFLANNLQRSFDTSPSWEACLR
jgi:hypothetical protein